jgi:hypothetical protein
MPATVTLAIFAVRSLATLGFVAQIEPILCVVAKQGSQWLYSIYLPWVTNNRTILKAYLHVRFQAAILH